MRRSQKRRNNPVRFSSRTRFESLEDRRLMAADLVLDFDQGFDTYVPMFGAEVDGVRHFEVRNSTGLHNQPGIAQRTIQGTTSEVAADFFALESIEVGEASVFYGGSQFVGPTANQTFGVWKYENGEAVMLTPAGSQTGTGSILPPDFQTSGGHLFFNLANELNSLTSPHLWSSDLTSEGTQLIFDAEESTVDSLTAFGDALFFVVSSEESDQIWKSDGTAEGTVRAVDTDFLPDSISYLHTYGESLLFAAEVPESTSGNELWISDGTTDGTQLLVDISTGETSSSPQILGEIGGELFLAATTAETGRELWKTDGTAAGTVLVKDLAEGASGSDPGVSPDPTVNGFLAYRKRPTCCGD